MFIMMVIACYAASVGGDDKDSDDGVNDYCNYGLGNDDEANDGGCGGGCW